MPRSRVRSWLATSLGVAAGLSLLWIGVGAYARVRTDEVTYETAVTLDGVEIRRYPETVVARTRADDLGTAFGRLFRYIEGNNRADETVALTAPVATQPEALVPRSESIPMTAPVATEETDEGTGMAFYLPEEYTVESAPVPDDPAVSVEREPSRTLAVLPFSWYATDRRVERKERRLLDCLDDHGLTTVGEPFLLRYDPPWTPPFMRRNEVAVSVVSGE